MRLFRTKNQLVQKKVPFPRMSFSGRPSRRFAAMRHFDRSRELRGHGAKVPSKEISKLTYLACSS
jgi:hypothetical protein